MPDRAAASRWPARPVSTYRLQLTAGFGFAEAAGIGGYPAALGVSHVYLSPILQAAPGSQHGYDVVDHSRISGELGGEAGFRAMVAALRGHGLGVVVDVVPNHMAIPEPEALNRQLWSVLADGAGSEFARWFDVDWAAGIMGSVGLVVQVPEKLLPYLLRGHITLPQVAGKFLASCSSGSGSSTSGAPRIRAFCFRAWASICQISAIFAA